MKHYFKHETLNFFFYEKHEILIALHSFLINLDTHAHTSFHCKHELKHEIESKKSCFIFIFSWKTCTIVLFGVLKT